MSSLSHLIGASAGAEYDCRRCGACCLTSAPAPGYVLLTDAEAERLGMMSLPVVRDAAGQLRLGTTSHDAPGGTDACVGFEGAPGFPCTCTIYEARPARCRDFEMGSEACRTARLRAGLPI
jgi:Fe-S-cluster containining protein